MRQIEDLHNTMDQENDSKENNSKLSNYILSDSDTPQTKSKSLYDSLKGMEPLIHWVKNKGRLFSPEAKNMVSRNIREVYC